MKGPFQFSLRQFLIGTTVLGLLLAWTVSVWTRLAAIDYHPSHGAAFERTAYEAFANAALWCAAGYWVVRQIAFHPKWDEEA